MTDTTNMFEVARLAEVSTPDPGTAGADWLLRVAAAVEDVREYDDREEGIHEVADALVPVYTSELWSVFTDLAAWQEDEEIRELAEPGASMDTQARVALYAIARRLLEALVAEDEEEEE